jgi:hypothetical protein
MSIRGGLKLPQNAAALREKLFTMRMSAEEWTRAEALAKHYGINVAALVRMLLIEREREVADKLSLGPRRKRS